MIMYFKLPQSVNGHVFQIADGPRWPLISDCWRLRGYVIQIAGDLVRSQILTSWLAYKLTCIRLLVTLFAHIF